MYEFSLYIYFYFLFVFSFHLSWANSSESLFYYNQFSTMFTKVLKSKSWVYILYPNLVMNRYTTPTFAIPNLLINNWHRFLEPIQTKPTSQEHASIIDKFTSFLKIVKYILIDTLKWVLQKCYSLSKCQYMSREWISLCSIFTRRLIIEWSKRGWPKHCFSDGWGRFLFKHKQRNYVRESAAEICKQVLRSLFILDRHVDISTQ